MEGALVFIFYFLFFIFYFFSVLAFHVWRMHGL